MRIRFKATRFVSPSVSVHSAFQTVPKEPVPSTSSTENGKFCSQSASSIRFSVLYSDISLKNEERTDHEGHGTATDARQIHLSLFHTHLIPRTTSFLNFGSMDSVSRTSLAHLSSHLLDIAPDDQLQLFLASFSTSHKGAAILLFNTHQFMWITEFRHH